jgi:tetratricopeptide (TPR) repeat protein
MRFKTVMAIAAVWLWPALASEARAETPWLEASSEHFVIYAQDSERDITRFSQQLERYHAGMALLLDSKAPAPSPSNRVTVYVVRTAKEVRELHGGDNKFIGGFYVPSAGGSLAIVPTVDSGNGPVNWSMVVLLHEYAHHFLISTSSLPMPRWFSEGAAEFFASSKFEPDGGIWLGRPANHRAGELFYATDVKAADLLDPTDYDKRKHTTYDAFYGKSWLLYHYLTFDESRKGQLTRYITLLRDGKGQRAAAVEAFGDFGVLEKDLDKYLAKRRMNALRLAADRVPIGAVAIRPLSAGQAAMMPVRIRSKRGVTPEEAKTLLQQARGVAARFPGDAPVLAALAECEYDAGNDKETIAAANAAIAIDPAQVNAYVQKGLALFRVAPEAEDTKAAYKAARAPFIALNRMENDHPLPLVYFYRSFVEQGEEPTALALNGLIRATQLAPFDLGLRMNLGQALLHAGRPDEARIILTPVAHNPHGGGSADYARKMIERIDKDPSWKGEGGVGEDEDEDETAETAKAD